MPYRGELDRDHNLLLVRLSGAVTEQEMVSAYRSLADEAAGSPQFDTLIQIDTSCDISSINAAAVERITTVYGETLGQVATRHAGAPKKLAVVCARTTIQMLTRLFFSHSDVVLGYREERCIVEDLSDALDWLGIAGSEARQSIAERLVTL